MPLKNMGQKPQIESVPPSMRVYHFLSAKNALDDLARRQVKISEIDKLNDPFELWCSAQRDHGVRGALRAWKKEMGRRYGMLCFCRGWHNPVLWSHYADRHQGICLGFDVDRESLKPVSYVSERTPLGRSPTPEEMRQLLYTKYRDWSYEKEFRAWFRLDECDFSTGYYLYSFDEKVRLREVIAGPLCDTTEATIDALLHGYNDHIRVVKARLAFRTFQIVKNKQGFRHDSQYRLVDAADDKMSPL
jgi:hypothetical protein